MKMSNALLTEPDSRTVEGTRFIAPLAMTSLVKIEESDLQNYRSRILVEQGSGRSSLQHSVRRIS